MRAAQQMDGHLVGHRPKLGDADLLVDQRDRHRDDGADDGQHDESSGEAEAALPARIDGSRPSRHLGEASRTPDRRIAARAGT